MSPAHLTRRIGNQLYRFSFPVYRPLYSAFKSYSDRAERALLRNHVPEKGIVVDAGANIGIYSAFLARCVGQKGRVHSFEPDHHNFRHLQAALTRKPNVRLNRLAVGDSTGESILFVSEELNVDHRAYPTEGEERRQVPIESVRLDDYFAPGSRVDLIKMDIQGYELHALQGAARVLSDNPSLRLLLEFWPYGLSCAGNSATELLGFLKQRGFRCDAVTANGLVPLSEEEYGSDDKGYYTNLFAQRK